MSQTIEQQVNKSFTIDTVDFETYQEYEDYIKKSQQKNRVQIPNTYDSAQQMFNVEKIDQEQDYQQFIRKESKKLKLPDDYKLEELKIDHYDMEFLDSNKQQQQFNNSENQKDVVNVACQTENFVVNVECQTENENENENHHNQEDRKIKQIQTLNQNIKIIEQNQSNQSNQSSQSNLANIEIEQNFELSQSKQNNILNQSPQNSEKQQYQNEQQYLNKQSILQPSIQMEIQQLSIKMNQIKKFEQFKKYDEIRDQEGKLIMKLIRYKLLLFENNTLKQIIKNEIFEKNYQFSLDNKNRKKDILESDFPLIIYNQQIGLNDWNILKDSQQFLTSSIIDAYSNYLQAKDEYYYFSLNKNERIKHKRLFIFNSDFLTNCNLNEYCNDKAFFLMMQYLQNFKVIQYQFWLIYKKIAFIVNSHIHWYLAVLDFNDGLLKIYDSLPRYPTGYNTLNNLLSSLFSKLSQRNLKFAIVVCPTWKKQQDHYSCGYHTCIGLEYLSQYQANSQCLTLEEIKKILINLLINVEYQQNQQLDQ